MFSRAVLPFAAWRRSTASGRAASSVSARRRGVVVAHGADVIHRPSRTTPVLSGGGLSVRHDNWINTVSRDHVERGVAAASLRPTTANRHAAQMARGD